MKKKYAIFWLEQKRNVYGDDDYYVLGTLFGVYDTESEAKSKIKELVSDMGLLTIVEVYKNK